MTGITFLKDQILSRSSKKWFDITPVAGTKKDWRFCASLFVHLSVPVESISIPGTHGFFLDYQFRPGHLQDLIGS